MTEYRVRYEITTALGFKEIHAYITRSQKRVEEVQKAIVEAVGYKFVGIDRREADRVQGLTENWKEWR